MKGAWKQHLPSGHIDLTLFLFTLRLCCLWQILQLSHACVCSVEPGKLSDLCFNSVVNFSLQFGTSSYPALWCLSLLRDTGFCHDSGSCWNLVVLVFLAPAKSTLTVWTTGRESLKKLLKARWKTVPHLWNAMLATVWPAKSNRPVLLLQPVSTSPWAVRR